jgi:inner membrane protein involved in colicin E2 resistance
MRFLRSFGDFWYQLIIGDDWRIAVSVVVALSAVSGLAAWSTLGSDALTLIGGVLIVAGFTATMLLLRHD